MAKNSNSWKNNKNAKFYVWNHSMGSASLYTSQAINLAAKNFPVNFRANNSLIKGTWSGYSKWNKVTNSYFQLKMVVENREYSFKYYENGKLAKDYTIVYDDAATKKHKVGGAYKVKGSKDDYVYLRNTNMLDIFGNPEKWSQSSNAVIEIMDVSKNPGIIKIK